MNGIRSGLAGFGARVTGLRELSFDGRRRIDLRQKTCGRLGGLFLELDDFIFLRLLISFGFFERSYRIGMSGLSLGEFRFCSD